MEDRFGPLPEPARYLADLTAIRNCGGAVGLRTVSITRRETRVKGDLKHIAPFLNTKRGWTLLGESALGPGGPTGAKELTESLYHSGPRNDEPQSSV